MTDLAQRTRYDPAEVEPRILRRWLESGIFHAEPGADPDETYSIAIPPPNITGSLHMGHALNGTIQDVLVRRNRMLGTRTKWIFGTDHAGIATQKVVERALEEEGTSREALGRERFVQRAWQWRERYGSRIVEQFKRLGASADYDDERFTLDPGYAAAVAKVFVDLYDKGMIYRDHYMVNWDPGSRSAISDLEVEDREVDDKLYSIDYPLASGTGTITVATVRPETMLGDTAIAVHPDDERYRRLIGETAMLPLVGRRLEVVADPYVKPEFGTGAVKITPGHDPNDFEIGRRHGLEEIAVIGEDGRMTAAAGERFAGLDALAARDAVVAALNAEGLISGERGLRHVVPHSHRSGARIEPLISLQWFMAMERLAPPAVEAVRSGALRITPERWQGVYVRWLQEIRPWCISRQLWWGHQIPVWYCDTCDETYVAISAPARCGACDGELRRDPDVLDTWFSSALWPFATLGWPQQTPELRAFYPTDVLSTANDILRLWVARMVMMGIEFTGSPPFSDVYIHSIIQAPDGRRMSKSLGTGIDPLQAMDAHGADAVRFGLLAMSSGQDVRYSAGKIAQGEQLANKLFNAARLILLRAGEDVVPRAAPATVEDRWILSRLARARREFGARVDSFDFSHAALGLYDFIYGELCDWYLELAKPRLYEDPAGDAAATLLHVLGQTLVLAHPIIPFVTEEIWSLMPGAEGLLAARVAGDAAGDERVDERAEQELQRVIEAVQALRGWRDGAGASPGARIPARLAAGGYDGHATAQIGRLARVEWRTADGDAAADAIATVGVPGGAVHVLASDAVDLDAARRRLAARREKLTSEIERAERKLANESFVAKAPDAVVQGERNKLGALRTELEEL